MPGDGVCWAQEEGWRWASGSEDTQEWRFPKGAESGDHGPGEKAQGWGAGLNNEAAPGTETRDGPGWGETRMGSNQRFVAALGGGRTQGLGVGVGLCLREGRTQKAL